MTTAPPTPKMQRSRLVRLIVALLVTIPLVLAAVYMWVLWDPTKKVDQMPVAIVNSDAGYVKDGEPLEAGAQVAKNLVDSKSLGFKLTDKNDAYYGLKTGHYYFVIEIPENFSETLGTIATAAQAPALMTVTFNDYDTLKASQIGGSAMEKIQQSVLKGVAATTVGGLVDGVQTLGDGLRTAADGSVQLSDGTKTLSEGTQTLVDGITGELQPGVGTAREGGAKLADGAGTLSAGLVTLQGGTDKLGDGATQVADGIEKLTGQIPLAEVEKLLKQAQAALPNSSQLSTVMTLIDGLQALKAGSRQIATELTDPNAQYRGGLNKLVDGGAQLSSGASELSAGLVKIDAGVAKVADGAVRLNEGAKQLDAGAGKLSTGLVAGSEKAPDFGDQDARVSLAQLISTPVAKQTVHVAQAQFQGPGGAVTILIIATTLIPIVVFMSFRGHRFVTDDESPRSLRTVARRGLAVSAISLAGVLVAGIGAWLWLDPAPNPVHLWQVILISAAATLMNVALISILFTLFGYIVGALSSLAWMMLQLFSYGGIWMIQTVPAPFQWLHWISPMTLVRHGYIAAFNGVPGFAPTLVSLLLLAVAGAGATLAAARYQRKRYADAVSPEADPRDEQVPEPTPV
ncbi:YhgE/Pip family protein [Gordonia sp. (in: high G+C Gram-positive bacteria)]|uniref:YhgE/Pip family protein n=1 Tax=Gordonia sp. (in: high G+C Gram-positive bacteria) TaxID=84139 RepID=UPI003C7948AD